MNRLDELACIQLTLTSLLLRDKILIQDDFKKTLETFRTAFENGTIEQAIIDYYK